MLLRVEAAGCTRRGEGFVCELPDGTPCSIVVGRPTPCISAPAVKTGP